MDAFDLAHGTETSRTSRLWWTRILRGLKSKTVHYQPVDPAWFAESVKNVPRWPFIDLGCGKGRGLILAHEAGFTDLTGIEFSPSLCRTARKNLQRCGIQARIVCADVRQFVFPYGPVTVFMYNPFGAEIMQKVLSNLGTGSRVLVYINPKHPALFQRFRLLTNLGHSHVYSTV